MGRMRLYLGFAALLWCVGIGASPGGKCPCGWMQNGAQCYKYFETQATRNEAEERCEVEGGHLVSIHSPEENNFVHHLSMCSKEDFWIGSHDKDSDRSWKWTDTSPWTYANWARVEHTGDWWLQNCAHMFALDGSLGGKNFTGGEWHIVMCHLQYNFVCEQPVSTRPMKQQCNEITTLCTPASSTTQQSTTTPPMSKKTTTPTSATSTRITTTVFKTPVGISTTPTTDATSSSATSTTLPAECTFTYNRICALRVDFCSPGKGGDILTYDQQMFTSDDLQNTNIVDGVYKAPETGRYAVNFWTKGFTVDGKVELYHNKKKIEWDQQNVYDQYHADVALSVGDILYIWVSEMGHCKKDGGAWRLLNSVFCVEPNGSVWIWSQWGSWSSCSSLTGKRERTRGCINSVTLEWGKCAGEETREETECKDLSCPPSWSQLGSSCYLYNDMTPYMTWHQAELFCQKDHQAHLVSLQTEEENTFVWKHVGVDTHIHIGARHYHHGKSWIWFWPESSLNFTAWYQGSSPRDGSVFKGCAYMNVNNGMWTPQKCSQGTAFVCEKKIGEKFQAKSVAEK